MQSKLNEKRQVEACHMGEAHQWLSLHESPSVRLVPTDGVVKHHLRIFFPAQQKKGDLENKNLAVNQCTGRVVAGPSKTTK